MNIYKGTFIGIVAAWIVLITIAIIRDYDNSTLITFIMLAITTLYSSYATLISGSKAGKRSCIKRKSEPMR